MAVACTKPIDLGYPEELWATRTLALHARKHGPEAGHPCLAMLGRGTVSKLLTGAELRPHKIEKLQSGDKAETDEGQLMAVLSLSLDPGAGMPARGTKSQGSRPLAKWHRTFLPCRGNTPAMGGTTNTSGTAP